MEREIIFKTHTIGVDELNKRERQIYDAGYDAGHEDAVEAAEATSSNVFAALVIILVVGTIIFCISKWA